MAKISVILPTFNRARTLGRAISSVLVQDYQDFELIVVDDGSMDETASVIDGFLSPRLKMIAGVGNRGANWARNQGVRQASGTIICFLDSDDEYLPGKLAYVAAFFQRHPDIEVLLDSHELHTRRGGGTERRLCRNTAIDDPSAFRSAIFQGALFKATPAISARRPALLDAGLFDESLRRAQDLDLILRLSRAHSCASTGQILWRKHDTADAISGNVAIYVDALIDICERHREYYEYPLYRARLRQYLARHFLKLAKARRWPLLWRDLWRAKCYAYFDLSLSRLGVWIGKQLVEERLKQALGRHVRDPRQPGAQASDRKRGSSNA